MRWTHTRTLLKKVNPQPLAGANPHPNHITLHDFVASLSISLCRLLSPSHLSYCILHFSPSHYQSFFPPSIPVLSFSISRHVHVARQGIKWNIRAITRRLTTFIKPNGWRLKRQPQNPFHPILFCFPHVSHLYLLLISGKYTHLCARQCALKAFQLAIDFSHLFSFFQFFFHLHQTLIWFFHISFLCFSLSLSCPFLFLIHIKHLLLICTHFLSYSIPFFLALSIFSLCFFMSGTYCGWRSTVWKHCSVSVCMYVCLGKDMLLTLWLSFMLQIKTFIYLFIFFQMWNYQFSQNQL